MSKDSGSPVDLAVAIYGCKVEDLLSYHEFEDGSVAIIAPTGQKFTYPAEQLLQQLMVQAAIEMTAIGRAKKAPDVELVPPTPPSDILNDIGADDVAKTAEMEAPAESPQAGYVPEAAGIGDPGLVTETAAPEAGHVTGHKNDSAGEVVIPVDGPGDPGAGDVTGHLASQAKHNDSKKRSAAKRKSAKRANTGSAE